MLTENGALALRTLLNFANRVFSVTIPGTSISFRSFFLSILVTSFVIVIAKSFINILDMTVSSAKSKVNDYKRSQRRSERNE